MSIVQVNGQWFTLTLAEPGADKIAYSAGGGSGQGDLIKALSSLELAQAEKGRPKRVDHVHLSRFDKTDLVQWYGRHADGYHRPIGRIMQIVKVKAPIGSGRNRADANSTNPLSEGRERS